MTPSSSGSHTGSVTFRVLGVEEANGSSPLDRLADRDGFAVRTVDSPGSVGERVLEESIDCVVTVHDDGDGVSTVPRAVDDRGLEVPVVVCARDPGVATDAFEAGATDFLELGDDPDYVELLARRVENAVERVRARSGLHANRDALDEFRRITGDDDLRFEEKVRRLLAVGRDRVDTGTAFLSRVDRDAGRLEVVEAVGDTVDAGDEYDLSTTYCRRTVETGGPLRVPDAPDQGWADDSAREVLGADCYLGVPVTVDGDTYGTVTFVDPDPREAFAPDEVAVARVVAEWVGNELERWRTQNRLESTLERIDDGFLAVDGDGRFTYVNDRAEGLLDVDADALLGEHLSEGLPAGEMRDALAEALSASDSFSLEWYHGATDRWLDTRIHPATDGVSVYLRDVTGRKERDRELRRYETIVETAPDGAYILDEDLRFVAVNDRLTDLTGYSREEMIGSSPDRYLDDEDLERVGEARERVRADPGSAERVEVTVYPREGDPFPCEVRFSGLHDEDGEFQGSAGIVRDVTDRVERERTLRELQETTRELIGTDSREAAARLAVEAADRVLGFRINAVRLFDPEAGLLAPTAATDAVYEVAEEGRLSPLEPGEGIVGDAFERGEVVEYGPDAVPEYEFDVERGIVFPLERHGVFTVATEDATPLDDPDRSIAEVLATTVTAALDRLDREKSLRDREHRLRRLVEATHDLMAAPDAETTMEIASEAAADDLDFPGTGIRRHDPESETLRSVSLGQTVGEVDDRPPYPVEDSPHGQAFRSGETVVDRIAPNDPYDRDPFAETMYVPLGDHGVLSVGVLDGEIGETDRQLAELLAASTEAALDRAERREALERQEDVLETVQGMVYSLDPEGRFTLVSDPLADRLGYDREDLVGTHVSAIFDDDAVEAGRRIVDRLLDGEKESTARVTEVSTADGDRIPVEVEMSLLPGDQFRGTVGVVRDRTELERTRTELERERDRFSRLFHNLPDPISDVEFEDGVPVIREVNAAYEETFGGDREELIGASPNEFIDAPRDAEFGLDPIDERVAAGELVTEELRRVTADGVRDFLFRGIPYRTDDEETMAFGIYTDITEQKHLQRRLGVLNRVLRHNVRNNVTVVLGYAELLAEEAGDDPYLSMAASELYEAAEQVSRLGTQAREAEQLFREDEEGPVDMAEVVDRVVEEYRDEFPDADIETDLPPELPIRASERVELAIENLIDNAVEHTDDPTVRVTGGLDENWVWIQVADDGPGIPAHERAVIESDRRETQLDHGSGLGLWIVRWTVDAFGGTLAFSDSELGGAAVELRFPRLVEGDSG